jgi:signal transduction histidine kinase/CHASE3 domain sensor protein/ActR/RegA family two-component response regulator
LKSVPAACAVFSIAIGLAVLAGWVLDVPFLKAVVPGFVSMKVNTAIGFVLTGASLLLLAPEQVAPGRSWPGRLLAVVVILIGALTLGQEMFGWHLGIDQALLEDVDTRLLPTLMPGRMAVTSAIAFVLLGGALLAIDWTPQRGVRATELMVLAVMSLASISVAQYFFARFFIFPAFDGTTMAMHTCVTFILLGSGVLVARPNRGILRSVRGRMVSPLEHRVYWALAVSLLAVVASGTAAYLSASDADLRTAAVKDSHETRLGLARWLVAQQDLETGERGYAITGKAEFLEPFELARTELPQLYGDLVAMVQDNPAQFERLKALVALGRQHVQWLERVVERRRSGDLESAALMISSGEGRRLMEAFRARVAEMDSEEARQLRLRELDAQDAFVRLRATFAVSTLLGLIVLVFSSVVIHRDFGKRQRAEQTIREQNEQLELRVVERTAQLRESETRLRTTVENLGEGVIVCGLDGQVLNWNRAAAEMFGLSPDDSQLRSVAEIAGRFQLEQADGTPVPVDQWPLARVLSGDTLRNVELGCRLIKENSSRVFSFGGVLIYDAQACPLMAIFTIADITERKQAEQLIRSQLQHLSLLDHITRATGERQDLKSIFQVVVRSLEDSLPIDFGCVCLYDADAHAFAVSCVGERSPQLAHDLAMDRRAIISVDANGLTPCLLGQQVYEPDVSQSPFDFLHRLARGGLHSVVISPLASKRRVFGMLVVARRRAQDFSNPECEFLRQLSEHVALAAQQAQLYSSLQDAYEELQYTQQAVMQEERLRALGQMASGVAHDINNALSPVSLYTESLLDNEPNLSERARRYLVTIQRAVDDVAKTVARMREFYRQREPQIELSAVDVNEMAQQVLELTKARWSDMALQDGITIHAQVDLAQGLPMIMGVESEIREALTNLVINAADAMPHGGELTLRTRLLEGLEQASVAIEVVDSGVGMDEATRSRCLEPFFTTKGEQGTGLGLAMVFGMVQRHSAAIEIDSQPGLGTTMRLVFAISLKEVALQGEPGRNDKTLSPLRLLLVDDDPVLLKSMRDALETEGHAIVTANAGQEGIDRFLASLAGGPGFSAVLTDLGMPYVDGRKVAAAVKAASPTTPVILLTGWGQRLVAEGDIPPGVDRVLAKPPKLREVREALAQVCSDAIQ